MAAPAFDYDGQLFSTMFAGFKEPIDAIFGSGYGAMIGYIRGPLALGLTIYIGLVGYAVIRGAVQYPARELLYRMFALSMLWFLVTSQYGTLIAENFYRTVPSEISTALGGTSVDNSGQFFDQLVGRGFDVVNEMADKQDEAVKRRADERAAAGDASWGEAALGAVGLDFSIEDLRDSIILALAIIVTVVCILLCACVGFTMVIFVLFALVIVLTVGPLFVAALLFDSTRGWFMSWLSQVINYVLLFVILILVVTMILTISERAVEMAGERETPLAMGLVASGFFLVGAFIFFQLPAIASGLAGGAASGASQFASAVFGAAGNLARGGNPLSNYRAGRSFRRGAGDPGGAISRGK
ncbi:type IV secretion system protein [Sphingomonas mollis]|uniref:Type IV secretion system protein n=1 Tax=Sphingomonas mollis TaxID=2795726 RepID=A0ABS0XUC1_9SPHN|nr:type IV secretion system protein [Sphingomonas sp. BT553]MBJ6123617.1 type IV secretion system protein [Sphingomonas sp. BT553]